MDGHEHPWNAADRAALDLDALDRGIDSGGVLESVARPYYLAGRYTSDLTGFRMSSEEETMRLLIVFCSVTVDGFMAGPDNDLAFMVDDEELESALNGELMEAADTIVVGRKSFPPMASYWMAAEGDLADWMNSTPKIVLSTDDEYDVSGWDNASLAGGDGVEAVRRLKDGDGKSVVVFGGVETVRGLVTAGIVDEYWFKVHPVVVGRGRSMFFDVEDRTELKLRSVRSFPTGSLGVIYTA